MPARYLLDTNILSNLVCRPQGKIAQGIERDGEKSICTSIVVAAELRFGAEKRGSRRLTTQLEAVLSVIEILPLEEPADRHYGKLRRYLEKKARPSGRLICSLRRMCWHWTARRSLPMSVNSPGFTV
jgi:tRNA(fMet)-specific endonuclease VapC